MATIPTQVTGAGDPGRRLRLDTLVRLRWMAVAGQTFTLLVVHYGLGYRLPLAFCLALVSLSVWVNLFLKIRFPASRRLSDRAGALMLGYDILQLGGLLSLTGGLANPFTMLLVVPVLVSATALGLMQTVALGGLATAVATLLAVVSLPLPWAGGQPPELPVIYRFGLWTALVSSLAFMSAYAFRVAKEARQLQAALAATELVLSREQHLHQLDGLAAAAAHELGTPLATIALVVRELDREIPADAPWRDDIQLLRSQSERCREILTRLASLSTDFDGHFQRLPLSHLIEEVVAPHREFGIDIRVVLEGDRALEPVGDRNPAIVYGLGNLVENAVDFARGTVEIACSWTETEVRLVIRDDGPGFSPEILGRLGEPYVTSRPASGALRGEGGGLGLGVFIAKTLLERTGATVRLANRLPPESGASISLLWPRPAMETGEAG